MCGCLKHGLKCTYDLRTNCDCDSDHFEKDFSDISDVVGIENFCDFVSCVYNTDGNQEKSIKDYERCQEEDKREEE